MVWFTKALRKYTACVRGGEGEKHSSCALTTVVTEHGDAFGQHGRRCIEVVGSRGVALAAGQHHHVRRHRCSQQPSSVDALQQALGRLLLPLQGLGVLRTMHIKFVMNSTGDYQRFNACAYTYDTAQGGEHISMVRML